MCHFGAAINVASSVESFQMKDAALKKIFGSSRTGNRDAKTARKLFSNL